MELSKDEIRKYQVLAIEVMNNTIVESRKDSKTPPKVGAVIVFQDKKTGETKVETAFRCELREGDHAEYTLLDKKLRTVDVSGAIMFVTLEPCAPGSRKHPKLCCADRVLNARVSKIYVGIEDPDPTVATKGIKSLESNGVQVEMFDKDLQEVIKKINHTFLEEALDRAKNPLAVSTSTKNKIESIALNATLSDLSNEALSFYINARDLRIGVESDALYMHLRQLELLIERKDEQGKIVLKPTYGCILLFGKNPSTFLMSSTVTAIKHTNGSSIINSFDGPLVLQPRKIEDWYISNAKVIYDRSTFQAKEEYIVPLELFREGMINALVHRDYESDNSGTKIILDKNAVEILSPGLPSLPNTIQKLIDFKASSYSRYPILTYIFRCLKYMENSNIGLSTFKSFNPQVKIQYQFEDPMLKLSFSTRNVSKNYSNQKENHDTISHLDDIDDDFINSLAMYDDSSRTKQVLKFIANKGYSTKSEIMSEFELSESTVRRLLTEMRNRKAIIAEGSTKNRRFSINKKFFQESDD